MAQVVWQDVSSAKALLSLSVVSEGFSFYPSKLKK